MRKQELIHLHALCLLLRNRLAQRLDLDPEVLAAYDALGVGPTAIHRPKSAHRRAVTLLLDPLATALHAAEDSATTAPSSVRPDHRDD